MLASLAERMAKTLYLVAGEHSGDTRGGELMEALREHRERWSFRGLGGPRMAKISGGGVRDWVEEAAVVGIWEVLKRYSWFRARFEETKKEIEELDPDAVIFVDYPGFNLRLARALREGGYRGRLIDYVSPQVWAWNRGRIPRLASWLDLMLCLFPFEKELFEEAGLKTVWMGHPMVDQLEAARVEGERDPKLVGLFPGSREREVARLFPLMIDLVAHLHERYPGWMFEASAASSTLQVMMQQMLASSGHESLPLRILERRGYVLMQQAQCGVVASGTATLEATYYGMPYCLVYKVAWPTYLAGRALVDINHLGMANILAGREVVREFIQEEANVPMVGSFVESVMTDPIHRAELQRDLLDTAAKLGEGGAARIAANAIADLLE